MRQNRRFSKVNIVFVVLLFVMLCSHLSDRIENRQNEITQDRSSDILTELQSAWELAKEQLWPRDQQQTENRTKRQNIEDQQVKKPEDDPTQSPVQNPVPDPMPNTGSYVIKPGSEYYDYYCAYHFGDYSKLNTEEQEIYSVVKPLIDEASQKQSDYEKELFIHDYIVNNCVYDHDNVEKYYPSQMAKIPKYDFTPYGVFVKGIAVCEGYAKAFKLCMDLLGIESIYVTGDGNGVSHMWNAVKLDEWYMIDVTWDDPVTEDGTNVVQYDYFNVTDEIMKKDHTYKESVDATGKKYNYYSQQDNYFESLENYYIYVNNAIARGLPSVTAIVYFADGSGEEDTEALGDLLSDPAYIEWRNIRDISCWYIPSHFYVEIEWNFQYY